MKSILICVLLTVSYGLSAQLFDHPDRMRLVRRGVDHIYNMEPKEAQVVIDSVKRVLPGHPVGPLMEASLMLWKSMPYVTADSTFERFTKHLNEVINLAARLDGGRQEDPEAVFFELAARGLLAEYYADAGSYMRAASEANKTYSLLKIGAKLTEDIPDFYLTTGVYNYFREKYPERYPVYKPFIWFFRNGDIQLGIQQLQLGCEKGLLTKVESYIYLSYIYLRYEYEPEKAVSYLHELLGMYPKNRYVKAKYLEALTSTNRISKEEKPIMDDLCSDPLPYFQLAGNAFLGYFKEKKVLNTSEAKGAYLSALSFVEGSGDKGEFYISLAHLGLARIYRTEKQYDLALKHGRLAESFAETPEIASEAKALVASLGG